MPHHKLSDDRGRAQYCNSRTLLPFSLSILFRPHLPAPPVACPAPSKDLIFTVPCGLFTSISPGIHVVFFVFFARVIPKVKFVNRLGSTARPLKRFLVVNNSLTGRTHSRVPRTNRTGEFPTSEAKGWPF